MEIKANAHDISEIFNKDKNHYYQIPKYQREYTWGLSQWTALYDDLVENNKGYFLGTIICIPHSSDSLGPTCLEVVDGQQRLTTISLLMAAVKSKLDEVQENIPEDNEDDVKFWSKVLEKSLYREDTDDNLILCLQKQNHNRDDYVYVMGEAGIISQSNRPPYYGNRNIKRCYDFFRKQIQDDMDESEKPITALLNIRTKLFSAGIVQIEVGSQSDAYVMFESLNNRGMSLTAVDLMKNATLAKASKLGLDIDWCYTRWQEILELITDEYSIQERFFRFNYNAFRKEINKPFMDNSGSKTYPLGDQATKSNLLNIYLKLIERDPSEFLDSIRESALLYHRLIAPEQDDPYRKEFRNLNNIKGVSGYILLLYLLQNKDELELGDSQIKSITSFLSRFFVRRNITDTPPTRDINRMFIALVSEIKERQDKGEALETYIYEFLKAKTASDDEFREKLTGDVYIENSDATRYLLCALAEDGMNREKWTDLWERKRSGNKMNYIWTIEHILPEGGNMPDAWIEMIANGDKEKATEIRNEYCHKLGNLTITGYNSNLSNMSFEKKRDRVDDKGNYIGYKNGLELNSELAQKDNWTAEDIQARTESLVSKCMELFKL